MTGKSSQKKFPGSFVGSACECTGVALAQEHPDRVGRCWGGRDTERGTPSNTNGGSEATEGWETLVKVGSRPCRGGGG